MVNILEERPIEINNGNAVVILKIDYYIFKNLIWINKEIKL